MVTSPDKRSPAVPVKTAGELKVPSEYAIEDASSFWTILR